MKNCLFCGLPIQNFICEHTPVFVAYEKDHLKSFRYAFDNMLYTLYFDKNSNQAILYIIAFNTKQYNSVKINSANSWNPENFPAKINNLLPFL